MEVSRRTPFTFVSVIVTLAIIVTGCTPPYMKMNPPADSDKPLPVPAGDNSCWLHSAANMLAGAGYGTGTTLQARADDIFADMNAQYGTANGGFPDAALQWWLASTNNIWPNNPYDLVSVIANNGMYPWANANAPRDLGNQLRSCNFVSIGIRWPTGNSSGGSGGHAITDWGDSMYSAATTLTTNPGGLRVTDSDTDRGGDVQAYTYDTYTNPNPGGVNNGNGWYFNYGTTHPFISYAATLSPGSGTNSVRVTGSYQITQTSEQAATDLHYRVSTDVDIITYRTWIDWPGTPTITESQPRRELTVDWDLSQKPVPQGTTVTINTEFVEPSWNYISYHDVHFTYPKTTGLKLADIAWRIETPKIERAEKIRNVTGGYVIGSFDLVDLKNLGTPVARYRFVHQYLYNQAPELHTFQVTGTSGFAIRNLAFGHSYAYPTTDELWKFQNWMTRDDKTYDLGEKGFGITIDWKGRLPYPEGFSGNNQP